MDTAQTWIISKKGCDSSPALVHSAAASLAAMLRRRGADALRASFLFRADLINLEVQIPSNLAKSQSGYWECHNSAKQNRQPEPSDRTQRNRMIEPRRVFLKPDDWIPNSTRFPVLIYRNVVDYELPDVGEALTRLFESNGWQCGPRGNILGEYHYHSTAHEVIGITSGSAILGIGGPHSIRVAVDATDVLVLPAGTGHCRLADDPEFSVIVANPPGQKPDTCRVMASAGIVGTIDALAYPDRDPVFGADFRVS